MATLLICEASGRREEAGGEERRGEDDALIGAAGRRNLLPAVAILQRPCGESGSPLLPQKDSRSFCRSSSEAIIRSGTEHSLRPMKGRSQLPQAEPPVDWGDGSWTVDCSCGITFDDGEEMVSCDECGVWVHTRCSRYVGGEASFACHNCKAAFRLLRSARNLEAADDEEETEVARLLVELPTKTDACPPPPPALPPQSHASGAATYRPRFCGQIPLEERVHVNGVPVGKPSLFGDFSTFFTSQLWKCTSYLPQSFNFRYKEFPCWKEDEKEEKKEEATHKYGEEAENPANRGADVLFSLSKEILPYVPVKKFDSAMKREERKIPTGSRSLSCRNKDRSKVRTFGQVKLAKKRREEPREAKDWSGKKKARSIADKIAGETKRRGSIHFPGTKIYEFYEDKDLQVEEACNPDPKSVDEDVEISLEPSISGISCEGNMFGAQAKVENLDQLENSSKIYLTSPCAVTDVTTLSIDEVGSSAVYCLKQPKDENPLGHFSKASLHVVMGLGAPKLAITDLASGCKDFLDEPLLLGSKPAVTPITKVELNKGINEADGLSTVNLNVPARHTPGKLCDLADQPPQLINHLSENIQNLENRSSFASFGQRLQGVRRETKELKEAMLPRNGETKKRRLKDSVEHKHSLEIGHGSNTRGAGDSQSSLSKLVPVELNSAVSVLKDSSTSSSPLIPKLTISGVNLSTTTSKSSAGKASRLTKQKRVKVNSSIVHKEKNAPIPVKILEEVSENPTKCQSKISIFSGFNPPQVSAKHTAMGTLRSDNVVGSRQSQVASGQTKPVSSNLSQRTVKSHQTGSYTSEKASNASMFMHASALSNATLRLSDEELALLLHQELNSSLRVPRIPHVRQATGMQSVTNSGMNVFSRHPVYEGKDQISVFRRKNKEDGYRNLNCNSQELHGESRKKARMPSFAYHKRQQLDKKKESHMRTSDMTIKTVPLAPREGERNDPFSSPEISEQNTPAACSSVGDLQRNDGSVICRTLPGLIDDILSKTKHITYEKLCGAVRPHWYELRKPNGERYAYPTYLHAVHDCLRNRSEWSHLVEQGPKTNSSKRRKVEFDSDAPTIESESEKASSRVSKDEDNGVESHREDVPKGKRNARKHRRLDLHGTGSEESRKRGSRAATSDCHTPFSHSNNEGTELAFSEIENQGAGPHNIGNETSSSSSDDSS
ncbi:hypothetical protein ZIOFF_064007 [Zingiber officinale]|uniref:Zinc finger PHD-type domain-containing protein n=1 Tax=Zingiber officinale TaxID=94328 RepID=A0A8J5KHZ6_ZINOF|nr:hypothetical protein ZIOFF_064007 [Zingiber officinale]